MKLTALSLLFALLAMPAWALDLQSARSQGLVAERGDGYIEAVDAKAGGVSALVADVNAKRKEEYARIAAEKNQPVNVVAKLAAQQIMQGLPAGASYRDDSGAMKKR